MSGALAAAVRDVGRELGEVPVFCRGAGVYESPVALRAGVDPQVIARRVGGTVTGRGFVRIEVGAGALVDGIVRDAGYGIARVPSHRWDEWPRTFENPGFCVRYAYARAVWVGRWAADLGVRPGVFGPGEPEELALVEALGDMPGRAAQAERERDARPLVFCLEKVAGAYHDVHERCPALPLGDEEPGAVHEGRVSLAEAVQVVLGNGLNMIGESPRKRI